MSQNVQDVEKANAGIMLCWLLNIYRILNSAEAQGELLLRLALADQLGSLTQVLCKPINSFSIIRNALIPNLEVFSPSHPQRSFFPCTMSKHATFTHPTLSLAWLCLLVASPNFWQACGNSLGATCLAQQVGKLTINYNILMTVNSAFASYGAFWMSYATIFIPSSGILAAYTDDTELASALGIYLITWFMFTFLLL
jgi:GPR1/FUN34/yaaH family